MLPGIGGSEIVVIAVIALLVVGPKDLPKLLRQIGRFVGKMRGMADDFRSSFEDMARQSELDDLRKEVEALRTNRIPVLDDVRTEIGKIEADVSESLTPTTHFYSGAEDVASPDAVDFNEEPPVPVTAVVDEAPAVSLAKPKKPRAKAAVKPATPTVALEKTTKPVAKPRAANAVVAEATPAPKRTRSKSKAS